MADASILVREALKRRAPLPFGSLPLKMVNSAENALRVAWKALVSEQKNYNIDLSDDREDKISYKLVEVLNFLRNHEEKPIADFYEYFESVNVCSGYRDYQDKRIKQPDFAIKPRDNPYPGYLDADKYALFVEAKVIGKKGQRTSEYFLDGVKRFLDGEYAWAMPQGMVLAYVRTEQTVLEAIRDYLNGHKRMARLNVTEGPAFAKPPNREPKVCTTRHSRKWPYVDREGTPGDIELRHLWLACRLPI